MSEIFTSWGGERATGARAVSLKTLDFSRLTTPALPYGDGRSYGDSCLLSGGAMIEGRDRNRILAFDGETGLLTAEAGIRLCDIIAFAAPLGWFPAVLPGTRFVTLGGAIANDIHGKNHHRRGSFGCHVERLVLERSDKGLLVSSPRENADLFAATISGFGLTGVVAGSIAAAAQAPYTVAGGVFALLQSCGALGIAAKALNVRTIAALAAMGFVVGMSGEYSC